MGKQEKQIVRTREEREREGAYGRYITEYSWRQLLQGLRTRKKAIAVGFIAHFLPVNGGFLACSIMEGVENKKIYIYVHGCVVCSWEPFAALLSSNHHHPSADRWLSSCRVRLWTVWSRGVKGSLYCHLWLGSNSPLPMCCTSRLVNRSLAGSRCDSLQTVSLYKAKVHHSCVFLTYRALWSCEHWWENWHWLHSYSGLTTATMVLIDFLESMRGNVQNLNDDCTKRIMSRYPRKTACWTVAAGGGTLPSIHTSMKVQYWCCCWQQFATATRVRVEKKAQIKSLRRGKS